MEKLIVLDTETTGTSTADGDRIIEIGCVEIVDRVITGNEYQQYIKPDKSVGESFTVHEISDEFLQDKPFFAEIADEFIEYIRGQTLVIHNAEFDIGFLDYEFSLLDKKERVRDICNIIDSIEISKKQNPTARHSLDAVCRRYNIDTSRRVKHGALLDAQMLAEAYLALTGGQFNIFDDSITHNTNNATIVPLKNAVHTPVIYATEEELALHYNYFTS